jgi:hypothetical protein
MYANICPRPSTTVERALQISPFLTNKPNFQKVKLNVNQILTKVYGKKDTWWSGKKQSQTKPNKANFLNAQMNVNKVLTKDYENIVNCPLSENKPNSNPIQTQTNPNKPNFTTAQRGATAVFPGLPSS